MATAVNRIEKEFILNSILNKEVEFKIHGRKKDAIYKIESFSEDTIILQKADKNQTSFNPAEEIRIFFKFQNNYYTFYSNIIKQEENKLNIENPDKFYRNLQRKYERIKQKGLRLSFTIKGKKIELSLPKTETFFPDKTPVISEDFDPENIQELVKTFKDKMQKKVSENKIIMFRDKVPTSFEERFITKSGKIFWIQCTKENFPTKSPFHDDILALKKDIIIYLQDSEFPKELIVSELANILYTKSKENVYSEIYCPILYRQYVAGYIYIMNTNEKNAKLDINIVEEIYTFSKILSHSLVINNYFKRDIEEGNLILSDIIDLSADGLSFSSKDDELNRELELFGELKIKIHIDKKAIHINSRIVRKYKDIDTYYFALQFEKISKEDLAFLFKFLYGKPFSPQEKVQLEGGIPFE